MSTAAVMIFRHFIMQKLLVPILNSGKLILG